MSGAGFFALFIGLGAALVALVAGPIGQAVARRIGGRKEPVGPSTGEMTAERIAEFEQRLVDVETALVRVAELEERLDFAERLLAQPDRGSERERASPERVGHE
jgi:hypothetical protein